VIGDAGSDTYRFGRGSGTDILIDSEGTNDTVAFATDINPLDIILRQSGNDLRFSLYGTTDSLTIQNWYGGTANQTEVMQTGDGEQLLNNQVDQLIQAMASFSAQSGLTWEQGIEQRPQDVQTIVAANWH